MLQQFISYRYQTESFRASAIYSFYIPENSLHLIKSSIFIEAGWPHNILEPDINRRQCRIHFTSSQDGHIRITEGTTLKVKGKVSL
jgi:hypothetical protein